MEIGSHMPIGCHMEIGSHMPIGCHMGIGCDMGIGACQLFRIQMSHVTHTNESCHTYEWVMSHIWMCHNSYKWVMSHIWMSHVTYTNAPTSCQHRDTNRSNTAVPWALYWMRPHVKMRCVIYKWVMSHIYIRGMWHIWIWVMSHIWMRVMSHTYEHRDTNSSDRAVPWALYWAAVRPPQVCRNTHAHTHTHTHTLM